MVEILVGVGWLLAIALGTKTRVEIGARPELWISSPPPEKKSVA